MYYTATHFISTKTLSFEKTLLMMDCKLESQFFKPSDNLKQMSFPLEGWWMVCEKVRGSQNFSQIFTSLAVSFFEWFRTPRSLIFLAEPFWGLKLSLAIQNLAEKVLPSSSRPFVITTPPWIYISQSKNKLQFCKLFLELDNIQPQAFCYGAILVVTITFTSWFGLIANHMFCSTKYST